MKSASVKLVPPGACLPSWLTLEPSGAALSWVFSQALSAAAQ